jgi:hypothetical protein
MVYVAKRSLSQTNLSSPIPNGEPVERASAFKRTRSESADAGVAPTKKCGRCNQQLARDNFSSNHSQRDGLQNVCTACSAEIYVIRRATLRGALTQLLQGAKSSAAQRGERGRDQAAVCTLTLEEFEKIYERQRGCCYWFRSKKMSWLPYTAWQMSLERLDPELGYTADNCVLVCQEFNGRRTWTWTKIVDMLQRRRTAFDSAAFLVEVRDLGETRCVRCPHGPDTERNRNGKGNCKACRREYDRLRRAGQLGNIARRNCQHGDYFERDKRGNCKLCQKERHAILVRQPRGFLKRMASSMVSHSKQRGQGTPYHTFDTLVELTTKQQGRCMISDVPLVFSAASDWNASPERIDVQRTYLLDNIELICVELNSCCNRGGRESVRARGQDSQWTRAPPYIHRRSGERRGVEGRASAIECRS